MKQVLCCIALLLAGLSLTTSAQVSSGTITGTVRDPKDAVIAGAKVKVTQSATSVSRETVTDDRGQFSAPNLRPGEYSVTVTATGFQGRTFTGIRDFKKLLLESSDQVLYALAKNLVTYSSGAPITFADRPAVEAIVAKTKQQGGGVRTLIAEVVASSIFQTK